MKIDGDGLIFSTGKAVYANNGIVGISDMDGLIAIWEGYDDEVAVNDLSMDERIELADYMIGLWRKFRHISISPTGDEATVLEEE